MNNFLTFSSVYLDKIETELVTKINAINGPSLLKEAMSYSLQAGGKRIRPLLLLATIASFNQNPDKGLSVATAIEMLHTYSLIHDDLPAMDNDDYRRGKPTNHKVFGEAQAILAGDGLLTYCFEVIGADEQLSQEERLQIMLLLSRAAGPSGMVAGQVADMEAENQAVTLEALMDIHHRKTGKLLSFCVEAGALLATDSEEEKQALKNYATHLGIAFQIRDDILDVIGDSETIGKPVGSDEYNQKSTYVSLLSLKGAEEQLNLHIKLAEKALAKTTIVRPLLHEILQLVANRNH